jgi:hypothetical protein
VFASRPPIIVHALGPAAFDQPGRKGPKTVELSVAILDSGFRMEDAAFADWIGRLSVLVARFWAGFPTD